MGCARCSRRCGADARRGTPPAACCSRSGVAALVFGPFATYQLTLSAPRTAALLLADLAVGWSMIAAGLIICDRRPGNRIGPLAVLTGFAWFAGDFTSSSVALVSYVATVFHGWFDPLFAIIILAYPTGASSDRSTAGWRSGSSSSKEPGRSPRRMPSGRSPGGIARRASTRSIPTSRAQQALDTLGRLETAALTALSIGVLIAVATRWGRASRGGTAAPDAGRPGGHRPRPRLHRRLPPPDDRPDRCAGHRPASCVS